MEKMDKYEVMFHVSVMDVVVSATGVLGYALFAMSQQYLKILGM